MSAETWGIIAIIGFSLSAIALAAAVFIFIRLKIPAVIGDLSGKTVAREIQEIRDANVASGVKAHKSSRVNIDRGKLSEKVLYSGHRDDAQAIAHASRRLDRASSPTSSQLHSSTELQRPQQQKGKKTEQLSDNVAEVNIEERGERRTSSGKKTDILVHGRQTDVLAPGKQTDVQAPLAKTSVLSEGRATEVLREETPNGTSVLHENDKLDANKAGEEVPFTVVRSVILIHSDEVIK